MGSCGAIDPVMLFVEIIDPPTFFREIRRGYGSGYAFWHAIHCDPRYCIKPCDGIQRDHEFFLRIHQYVCLFYVMFISCLVILTLKNI